MDPSTMYLTAFLIIGGIIFLVLFFHYVPFFLWLSAIVSGDNIKQVHLFQEIFLKDHQLVLVRTMLPSEK